VTVRTNDITTVLIPETVTRTVQRKVTAVSFITVYIPELATIRAIPLLRLFTGIVIGVASRV